MYFFSKIKEKRYDPVTSFLNFSPSASLHLFAFILLHTEIGKVAIIKIFHP